MVTLLSVDMLVHILSFRFRGSEAVYVEFTIFIIVAQRLGYV